MDPRAGSDYFFTNFFQLPAFKHPGAARGQPYAKYRAKFYAQ
jgi:hypothetical protein